MAEPTIIACSGEACFASSEVTESQREAMIFTGTALIVIWGAATKHRHTTRAFVDEWSVYAVNMVLCAMYASRA